MKKKRITFDEYDKILDTCLKIKSDTHNSKIDPKHQFLQEDDFPSLDEFEEPLNHVGDYLPYLLYYSDVYEPPDEKKEEFYAIRGTLRRALYKSIMLIDSEDIAFLDGLTELEWKRKKWSEKEGLLLNITQYYEDDELDDLLEDYKKYPYLEKDFKKVMRVKKEA